MHWYSCLFPFTFIPLPAPYPQKQDEQTASAKKCRQTPSANSGIYLTENKVFSIVFPLTAAGWTKAERKMRKRRRKMMKPWIKVRRWARSFRSGPWRPSDPQRLHAVCWGLWGLWGSTEVAQKSLESMCVWQNSAVLQQCLTHWRSKWLGWHWSCHSTWWYVKPLSLAVQKQAACFCFEHPLWQYDLWWYNYCSIPYTEILCLIYVYIVDLDWPILAWLLVDFCLTQHPWTKEASRQSTAQCSCSSGVAKRDRRGETRLTYMDTLWWTNILPWKITIFNGKIHYKWPCSIAMLVHQRVYIYIWYYMDCMCWTSAAERTRWQLQELQAVSGSPPEDPGHMWYYMDIYIYIPIYIYIYMGLSENSVPLNPMVLLIIIPIKWL